MAVKRIRAACRHDGKFRPVVFFLLLLVLIILICGWQIARHAALPEGEIQLYFIDVGQGDASFVLTPDGSVLIDAGTVDAAPTLYQTISRRGNHLDYLLITHPHDDHMGGASYILKKMDVETIILPRDTSDISAYRKFMQAVEAEGADILYADPELTFSLGDAVFTVLAPIEESDDPNENSAIVRLDYGKFSALFTGDAGMESEAYQIAEYGNFPGGQLDVDILKVGHHGSYGASSRDYLKAVTPQYAVISCGAYNAYGHPHASTLERLQNVGATILRTDETETIVFVIDDRAITMRKR